VNPPLGVDFSLNALFQRSSVAGPPLKVGLVLPPTGPTQVARRVVEDIVESNFATICCVIHRDPAERAVGILPDDLCGAAASSSLLLRAYCRWLDSPHRREPDPLAVVELGALLRGIAVIDLRGTNTSANAGLRDLALDVIVNLDAHSNSETLAEFARHGVWSMRYGNLEGHDSAPLFDEVFEERAASHAWLLSHHSPSADPLVLSEVTLATTRTLSVSANRFDVCWSAQHFVIHNLFRLHATGRMPAGRSIKLPARTRAPARGNAQLARALLPAMRRAVAERSARDEVVHWRVGLRRASTPLFNAQGTDALGEFTWLQSPPGVFWADPCLISHGSETWIFFEQSTHDTQHGAILCARLRADGSLDDMRVALARPYHLSYPQVFEAEGAIWMIPETRRAERVELYRCVTFPDVWQLECPLLDVRAIDPTVFQWNSRWWMFLSSAAVSKQSPITWLFSSPQLTGPWRIHPASPVCTDARWSRGAGRVIQDGQRLLRPSQDCLRMYGYSVTFNEITRLDEERYEERPGRTIEPPPAVGMLGFHTYSRAGDWEAIDAQYRVARAEVHAPAQAVGT